MTPLMTMKANSAANVLEASVLIVAAVAIKTPPAKTKRSPRGSVRPHTLTDIGIERGSITWMC